MGLLRYIRYTYTLHGQDLSNNTFNLIIYD